MTWMPVWLSKFKVNDVVVKLEVNVQTDVLSAKKFFCTNAELFESILMKLNFSSGNYKLKEELLATNERLYKT